METIRWGVIGAGGIAHRWMAGAHQLDDTKVVAVASRSVSSAQKLADEFDIPNVEESTIKLLERDDIDAVYIGAPHTDHAALSVQSLEHGKAVLCEKPLAVNAKQAQIMIQAAKSNQRFLMEGMWMRFFPAFIKAQQAIQSGAIGDVRSIDVAYGFRKETIDSDHRLLSPALAGGALLDVGTYCLHFCQGMLGTFPSEVIGLASINTDEKKYGVDEQAMAILRFPGDILTSLRFAVKTSLDKSATIYGTKGKLYFPQFKSPETFYIITSRDEQRFDFPALQKSLDHHDPGFAYEIAHVNHCLRAGLLSSDELPLETSLELMRVSDELRRQWGLKYPCED